MDLKTLIKCATNENGLKMNNVCAHKFMDADMAQTTRVSIFFSLSSVRSIEEMVLSGIEVAIRLPLC